MNEINKLKKEIRNVSEKRYKELDYQLKHIKQKLKAIKDKESKNEKEDLEKKINYLLSVTKFATNLPHSPNNNLIR